MEMETQAMTMEMVMMVIIMEMEMEVMRMEMVTWAMIMEMVMMVITMETVTPGAITGTEILGATMETETRAAITETETLEAITEILFSPLETTITNLVFVDILGSFLSAKGALLLDHARAGIAENAKRVLFKGHPL